MLNNVLFIRFLFGIALAVVLTVSSGLASDTLGLSKIPVAQACGTSSGVGGGC